MTTDLRQWLETMAAEAAAARDAEPPREWSNGWHDGNRDAYHAVLTWLGDHPITADRDRLRAALEDVRSALVSEHGHDSTDYPEWPSCLPVHIALNRARAALAQPPAPAATAETLRDAAQGQVVAWSARAASLRMLRSERAIGEAIGLAQAAAELDAIVLTVPDAAQARVAAADAMDRVTLKIAEKR